MDKSMPDPTFQKRVAAEMAAQLKSSAELHPEDELLRYILSVRGEEVGVRQYFSGGYKSAMQAKRALDRLGIANKQPKILEFASGFGRVTRHLRSAFPGAELIASDIHPRACEFIEENLSISARVSAHEPESLTVGAGYDYIFVLSLFSHLPDKSFGRWIRALYDCLAPGGFLLFTANGQTTMRRRPAVWGEWFDPVLGYGYAEQSDQLDLDPKEYGSMAVSLSYMGNQITQFVPDALLHSFQAGVWFGQQDEWVIHKPQ